MKFLLVLAFAAVAVAVPKGQTTQGKYSERIVGGTTASPGQFPWEVAVRVFTVAGSYFCGGSLISDEWVLTAGHCAIVAYRFVLKFGGVTLNGTENGRVEVEATQSFVHPLYNTLNMNYDIALIKLPSPIQFNDKIQAIRLPKRYQEVGGDEKVTVSGWGGTSDESALSNTLNFVKLTTMTNIECTDDFYGPFFIHPSTLCCKGDPAHSPCRGDTGGPLVTYDESGVATLGGVVSFVHFTGCAGGWPSGYTRTESFLYWIHEHTGIPIEN